MSIMRAVSNYLCVTTTIRGSSPRAKRGTIDRLILASDIPARSPLPIGQHTLWPFLSRLGVESLKSHFFRSCWSQSYKWLRYENRASSPISRIQMKWWPALLVRQVLDLVVLGRFSHLILLFLVLENLFIFCAELPVFLRVCLRDISQQNHTIWKFSVDKILWVSVFLMVLVCHKILGSDLFIVKKSETPPTSQTPRQTILVACLSWIMSCQAETMLDAFNVG